MLLFTPQSINHDFAAYNTFLSKLNNDECIAFGKLTQGIPFIVEMADLDLDLTRDDVLGDKYQFVPAYDPNIELVKVDEFGTQIPVKNIQPELRDDESIAGASLPADNGETSTVEPVPSIPEIQQAPIELVEEPAVDGEEIIEEDKESSNDDVIIEEKSKIVKPVANILAAVTEVDDVFEESNLSVDELAPENDLPELTDISEDDFGAESFEEPPELNDSLNEDDLDFIEETQVSIEEPISDSDIVEPIQEAGSEALTEQSESVPVYPAESESDVSVGEFAQGDSVTHPRYGRGVVEKIIKYGNKTLCSIAFENVGRRLLDPSISELVKL